jgi:hypothetical protein
LSATDRSMIRIRITPVQRWSRDRRDYILLLLSVQA